LLISLLETTNLAPSRYYTQIQNSMWCGLEHPPALQAPDRPLVQDLDGSRIPSPPYPADYC